MLFPPQCPLRTFIQTGIWKGVSLEAVNCRSLWGQNCRHLNRKKMTSKEILVRSASWWSLWWLPSRFSPKESKRHQSISTILGCFTSPAIVFEYCKTFWTRWPPVEIYPNLGRDSYILSGKKAGQKSGVWQLVGCKTKWNTALLMVINDYMYIISTSAINIRGHISARPHTHNMYIYI